METYHRVNEMEKSKVLFDLRRFFEIIDNVSFSYLFGDFLFAHFFKYLNLGIYFDDNKISIQEWNSEIESYKTKLKEILLYPIEFLIINTAPLELQVDAVRGSSLSCTDEEERTRFLKEILKD
ncbi:MAG: hypothetical protein HGN29_14680 [Asgard group archaeon]|nr:hypothetical protein [Asgard group archaeon]